MVSAIRSQTFDTGGPLRPGATVAVNNTGRDEYVFTAAQHAEIRRRLGVAQRYDGGGCTGGGGSKATSLVLDGDLRIVNWDTGAAKFNGVAREAVDTDRAFAATTSRMG